MLAEAHNSGFMLHYGEDVVHSDMQIGAHGFSPVKERAFANMNRYTIIITGFVCSGEDELTISDLLRG